jgi:hypothetical protein
MADHVGHRTRVAARGSAHAESEIAIDLPPPFRLVKLREVGEAFGHAQTIAEREGAGTLVYVGRFGVVEFAVVLEPDEPLRLARRAFYAGLNALGDALSVHAPPARPITFRWPDAILVDGGLVGGGRLAWPKVANEDHVPDWIVFGGTIRTLSVGQDEGVHSVVSALQDAGFLELNSDHLIESFARHLMSHIDAWLSLGFAPIARNYVRRLVLEKGAAATIAANGDLLLQWRGAEEPERHSLVQALAFPTWLTKAGRGRRI